MKRPVTFDKYKQLHATASEVLHRLECGSEEGKFRHALVYTLWSGGDSVKWFEWSARLDLVKYTGEII